MANGTPPIGYIPLPAIAAIAWIPFYFQVEDVPPNAYKETRKKAYDILFDAGNRDPSDDLVNEAGFWQIIRKTHDYRGALFLSNLQIHRSAKAGFTHYNDRDFERLESVGYTPIRQKVMANPPYKKPWASYPERRGIGGSTPDRNKLKIDVAPARVTIIQCVDFRLCRLLGLGGGIMTLTLRDAPYAWMEMTMTIEDNGSFRIELAGSAVPSQKLYVGWQMPPNCTYDMITCSHSDIEQFFRAGRLSGIGATRHSPQRRAPSLFHTGRLW